jgi:beta-lysine 5,6-aminomutase alpha subunit
VVSTTSTGGGKLRLDPVTVRKARSLARRAGEPIVDLATRHTTVSVERATLRLAGLSGADPDGIPWVNRLLDAVRGDVGIEHGIALPVWDALVRGEADDLATLAEKASAGSVRFRLPEGRELTRARSAGRSAPAYDASTHVAASASGSSSAWAIRRTRRGST